MPAVSRNSEFPHFSFAMKLIKPGFQSNHYVTFAFFFFLLFLLLAATRAFTASSISSSSTLTLRLLDDVFFLSAGVALLKANSGVSSKGPRTIF